MLVLGLTGSIGMGKSTTAAMFRDAGIPVHDSDQAVHALYAGEAAPLIEQVFPGTVRNGAVDRALLGQRVLGDAVALKRLEAIVHPLVRAKSDAFVQKHREAGADLVVLDIPLLFEAGARDRVDRVLVVTADPDVQRARVLARPGMTQETFRSILARQMPDAEKRRLADHVIDTSAGLEPARQAVARLIGQLRGENPGSAGQGA